MISIEIEEGRSVGKLVSSKDTISSNTAGNNGGAFCLDGNILFEFLFSSMLNNVADWGGAAYCNTNSDENEKGLLEGVSFEGNQARVAMVCYQMCCVPLVIGSH